MPEKTRTDLNNSRKKNQGYRKRLKQKGKAKKQRVPDPIERQREEIRDYLLTFDMEKLRQHALTLDRIFVLHIGPTNSGKTKI